jgi:hypothetical protein
MVNFHTKITTVNLKNFADKNIGGNNICGQKMTLLHKEQCCFLTAKIFTANIFIRNFFGDDGIQGSPKLLSQIFLTANILSFTTVAKYPDSRFNIP